MKVDIYKRPEVDGQFSYLAVPNEKLIPEEVTNVDWEVVESSVELDEDAADLQRFLIHQPLQQIAEKGYAITSIKELHVGIDTDD